MPVSSEMGQRRVDTMTSDEYIALYIQVVVHTHIGDEATYGKFLHKHQHSEPACRKKIEAISYVENRLKNVGSLYKTCQRNGNERVYNICQKITQEQTCTFSKELRWKTCELSGHCSNSCVRIQWIDSHMYVDERFHPFVLCLWLITHMQGIETCRVDTYIASAACTETISEAITGFAQSVHVTPEADILNYTRAFEFVEETLKATCLATSCNSLTPGIVSAVAKAD